MKAPMRQSILLLLIVALVLGYGFVYTLGSKKEVAARMNELYGPQVTQPIDAQVLSNPILKEVEGLKRFGSVPPSQNGSIVRNNPFEGI